MPILRDLKEMKSNPIDIYACPTKHSLFGGNAIDLIIYKGMESLTCPICGDLHTYYSDSKIPVRRKHARAAKKRLRIKS